MRTKLINKSEIKNIIKIHGFLGNIIASFVRFILSMKKLEVLYNKNIDKKGAEFSRGILKDMNVTIDCNRENLQHIPEEGGFVVVCNHPFGGVDGLIIHDLISKKRPDTKYMVNFILAMIEPLEQDMFSVNPFSDNKELKNSSSGIRAAISHLKEGHGLVIFPAGEVSTYHGNKYTEDLPWTSSVIKLIKNAGVPIIPAYFHGTNSRLFHFLGKIHPMLRTVWLPRELLKRRNKTVKFVIGKPVMPAESAQYESAAEFGTYLRNRTYALEANVEPLVCIKKTNTKVSELAPAVNPALIQAEIEANSESILFSVSKYSCHLFDAANIPNIITELGRKREESFRAIGEGTGKASDLDEYDAYYKHLVLWDNETKCIAGAYRVGLGRDIMTDYGIKGFYTSTLFTYAEDTPYLEQSIELGRSFVSLEYKRENLPLYLLLKGLGFTLKKYTDYKYFLGAVSISNSFPLFYQSCIHYALQLKYSDPEYTRYVQCRNPFKPNYLRVDLSAFAKRFNNVEDSDSFISVLSGATYRVPTLLKKYLKMNGHALGYNIDPDFSDCLDVLVLLEIGQLPADDMATFTNEKAGA